MNDAEVNEWMNEWNERDDAKITATEDEEDDWKR